jgi:uncharacterized HAD superfamily protein
MSYATLGNDCIDQTGAITSNKKFLKPDNKVYQKYFTNMELLPGNDSDNINQKRIKSYLGKDTLPNNNVYYNYNNDKKLSCKSCKR